MCGITGFIECGKRSSSREREAIATAMHKAIAHRGPDDSDVWQDPDAPIALAHRRLAIIDLSPEGHQPMTSASGRYVTVYNGEIYNFPELRAQLEALGHAFRGRSDTEIMLTAFDQWGVNQTLQKINGMFAIALWDRKERTVHFIRDRFGKKPLYVGWAGDTLIFASELKSFHAHPDFKPDVCRGALTNYMRYGYVCAPFSIFKNVWQLLPASRLTLRLEEALPGADLAQRMEQFWFLPDVMREALNHRITHSAEQSIDTFEAMMKDAVKSRMMSDVPLGAFLSGGIDSSTVVAMMQTLSDRPVKTYSIGFKEAHFNEAPHAKKIAQHLGTDHKEFYVSGKEAMDVIPLLPDMYDEPFADSSQIPTYLVCKHAREEVTVVLTGDGGDEMLGGYDRHFMVPAAWKKVGWMPQPLRALGAAAIKALPQGALNALNPLYPQFGRRLHRLAGLVELGNPEDIYTYLMSAWTNPQQVVIGGREPTFPLTDPAWQMSGLNFSESMMYGDSLSYRPNDLMVKIDRAGMAVALEARAPLMDYKLFEYCARLPHDLKVQGLGGKWLLKQILGRYVPQNLWERPKMGFGVPINDWLRGPLKSWASDLLNPATLKAQGFLNADIIQKEWESHQKGFSANATGAHLWSVLMFQSWLNRWKGG